MGYFFYCKGVLMRLPRVSSLFESQRGGLFDSDAAQQFEISQHSARTQNDGRERVVSNGHGKAGFVANAAI
jgi:hypothetical protein